MLTRSKRELFKTSTGFAEPVLIKGVQQKPYEGVSMSYSFASVIQQRIRILENFKEGKYV